MRRAGPIKRLKSIEGETGSKTTITQKIRSEGGGNERVFENLRYAKEQLQRYLQRVNTSQAERSRIELEIKFIDQALNSGGFKAMELQADFEKWILGRGKEEDHLKTPWYRTAPLPYEVTKHLVETPFNERWDLITKVAKLQFKGEMNIIQDLNEAFEYFKLVIRGDEFGELGHLREYTNLKTLWDPQTTIKGPHKDEIIRKLDGMLANDMIKPDAFKAVETEFTNMWNSDLMRGDDIEAVTKNYEKILTRFVPFSNILSPDVGRLLEVNKETQVPEAMYLLYKSYKEMVKEQKILEETARATRKALGRDYRTKGTAVFKGLLKRWQSLHRNRSRIAGILRNKHASATQEELGTFKLLRYTRSRKLDTDKIYNIHTGAGKRKYSLIHRAVKDIEELKRRVQSRSVGWTRAEQNRLVQRVNNLRRAYTNVGRQYPNLRRPFVNFPEVGELGRFVERE